MIPYLEKIGQNGVYSTATTPTEVESGYNVFLHWSSTDITLYGTQSTFFSNDHKANEFRFFYKLNDCSETNPLYSNICSASEIATSIAGPQTVLMDGAIKSITLTMPSCYYFLPVMIVSHDYAGTSTDIFA